MFHVSEETAQRQETSTDPLQPPVSISLHTSETEPENIEKEVSVRR